ncbi:RNA polymerase II elongation factor ELL [Ceraceosorus bombacis]|uniref:RNA polymerase II elongation factor ELL n=1 Tax=Ceraceosorus bombacis TaxID=401625 RepID=A0A0P1BI57_9BASI|nr:RNA polymerase II elongation factor ELL [Ceraceosorus bombacis]
MDAEEVRAYWLQQGSSSDQGHGTDDPPKVIHLRLSQEVVEALRAGSHAAEIDLSANGASIILGGISHPLSKAPDESLHELYAVGHARSGAGTLRHVGAISHKYSAKSSSMASSGAASRLKERREEEAARRDARQAVLMEQPTSSKRAKALSSAVSTSDVSRASPVRKAKRGILGSPAQLITGVSSRPATPMRDAPSKPPGTRGGEQTDSARAQSLSRMMSNAAPSVRHENSDDADAQAARRSITSSPPSLRTRLIHLLATGPLQRRILVAQLKSPEPQIVKLLSSLAVIPQDLQVNSSDKMKKHFKGPVNRRSLPAPPANASAPGTPGPGTVYALKDTTYQDVQLDWPEWNSRTKVEVSDLAEAAFNRLELADDAPQRLALYPDGRPTQAAREEWRRNAKAKEAVEKMDDGEDLSEEGEWNEEEDDAYAEKSPPTESEVESRSQSHQGSKGLGLLGAEKDGVVTQPSESPARAQASDKAQHSLQDAPSGSPPKANPTPATKASASTGAKKKGISVVSRVKRSLQSRNSQTSPRAPVTNPEHLSDTDDAKNAPSRAGGQIKNAAKTSLAAKGSAATKTTKVKGTKRPLTKEEDFDASLASSKRARLLREAAAERRSPSASDTTKSASSKPAGLASQKIKKPAEDRGGPSKTSRAPVLPPARDYTDTEDDQERPHERGRSKHRVRVQDAAKAHSDQQGIRSRVRRSYSSSVSPDRAAQEGPRQTPSRRRDVSASPIRSQTISRRESSGVQARHGVGAGALSLAEPWLDMNQNEDALTWRSEPSLGPNGQHALGPAPSRPRAPMPFEKLVELVQRQEDLHGQLRRMMSALKSSKERIEHGRVAMVA